jgi:CyaY protein
MSAPVIDERRYEAEVATLFRSLDDALAEADPDVVEVTRTGDMITMTFASGIRCVLNTQRAVRQLWLAARATAWHFDWDAATGAWHDDKGRGELRATLREIIREHAGQDLLATW